MAFTKEQLAKLGITITEESVEDAKAFELIEEHNRQLVADKDKFKNANDKLSKENADYKRQAQEKLSEDEKRKIAEEEKDKKITELQKQVDFNKKVSELVDIGYPKDLAEKYANRELEGKSTAEIQKQFVESKLEAQKQDLLKGTSNPALGGTDPTKYTRENFLKGNISMEEMNKLKETDPATYNAIVGVEQK